MTSLIVTGLREIECGKFQQRNRIKSKKSGIRWSVRLVEEHTIPPTLPRASSVVPPETVTPTPSTAAAHGLPSYLRWWKTIVHLVWTFQQTWTDDCSRSQRGQHAMWKEKRSWIQKGDHFEDVLTEKQGDGDGIMESMCNSNRRSKPVTKHDKETDWVTFT